jgi:hypothetical protein
MNEAVARALAHSLATALAEARLTDALACTTSRYQKTHSAQDLRLAFEKFCRPHIEITKIETDDFVEETSQGALMVHVYLFRGDNEPEELAVFVEDGPAGASVRDIWFGRP